MFRMVEYRQNEKKHLEYLQRLSEVLNTPYIYDKRDTKDKNESADRVNQKDE